MGINDKQIYNVIIIGSGPAGLTAAVYTSRAKLKTLVVAGESWGGQLMLTTEVENYPGFEEGLLGPELMEKMKKQALRFGAEWVEKNVTGVQFGKYPFEVVVDKSLVTSHSALNKEKQMTNDLMTNDKFFGRAVIVATGAEAIWLGVPGEAKLIGRGVSSCAPCDAAFFRNKRVVVVGGGDTAMEEALVLTKFASEVFLVHRRDSFRASKIMIDKVLQHSKIKVFWDSEIVDVKGEHKLESVNIKTKATRFSSEKQTMLERGQGTVLEEKGEEVIWQAKIDGVFVAVGHKPITEVFKEELELDEKGYILKNSKLIGYQMATSKEGVFVAGDVHDHHYRQAVTAAAFGCMAGMEVERWLEDSKDSN